MHILPFNIYPLLHTNNFNSELYSSLPSIIPFTHSVPFITLYLFTESISLHNPQFLFSFDTYIELSHIELQTPSGIIRYFPSQPVPHLLPSVSRILLFCVHCSKQLVLSLIKQILYAVSFVMASIESVE